MSKKHKVPSADNFDTAVDKYVAAYSLANHPELIEGLFDRLGLRSYFDAFCDFTPEEEDVYHGRTHSFQVALNAYEGGLYAHLDSRERRAILVAGLYHDAKHAQGFHVYDRQNIVKAIDTLQGVHSDAPEHQKLTAQELDWALAAIAGTEYPYKVKKPTGTLLRVLRDADVMSLYTTDIDVLESLFRGLLVETNRKKLNFSYGSHDFTPQTVAQFCEDQAKFATKQEWLTSWGKIKAYKCNWPEASKRMIHVMKMAPTRAPKPFP